MFKGSIHLDLSDKIKLKTHKGMRHDFVLYLGDSCRVFLSFKQLRELKEKLEQVVSEKK
jgi:hypothetical protein